jgi:transcription antitermination factor NusA-like protein
MFEAVVCQILPKVRADTRQLYSGMFHVARALDAAARHVGEEIERLNRRLLVRTGRFLGSGVVEEDLRRAVRDPGVRSKLLWAAGRKDGEFCLRVGKALRERIHGVPDGPIPTVVAGALRPAAVDPAWVTVAGKTAVVRVPASEVGRAIGRGGGNVSLASRLVGLKIEIRTEGRSHD